MVSNGMAWYQVMGRRAVIDVHRVTLRLAFDAISSLLRTIRSYLVMDLVIQICFKRYLTSIEEGSAYVQG